MADTLETLATVAQQHQLIVESIANRLANIGTIVIGGGGDSGMTEEANALVDEINGEVGTMVGLIEKLLYLKETKRLFREKIDPNGDKITDETTFRQFIDLIGGGYFGNLTESEYAIISTAISTDHCPSGTDMVWDLPHITEIPIEYEGSTKSGLGDTIFNRGVTKIKLDSVTEIPVKSGGSAISSIFGSYNNGNYNNKLSSISLANVKHIPTKTFDMCTLIKSIYAPNVETISERSFIFQNYVNMDWFPKVTTLSVNPCGTTEQITGQYVTSIGSNVFKDIACITTLELPNLEIVGDYAFSHAFAKINPYVTLCFKFPKVTRIGKYAFSNNQNVVSRYIFNNLEYVSTGAFEDTYIETVLDITPKSDTLVFEKAFGRNNFMSLIIRSTTCNVTIEEDASTKYIYHIYVPAAAYDWYLNQFSKLQYTTIDLKKIEDNPNVCNVKIVDDGLRYECDWDYSNT